MSITDETAKEPAKRPARVRKAVEPEETFSVPTTPAKSLQPVPPVTVNGRIAALITRSVGTMWCAYFFAAIALISLPSAIGTHEPIVIVAWVAQTFLQLVLLSIILVGQSQQAGSISQKIDETHDASLAEFEMAKEERQQHKKEMAVLSSLTREIHKSLKVVK